MILVIFYYTVLIQCNFTQIYFKQALPILILVVYLLLGDLIGKYKEANFRDLPQPD